MKSVVASMVLVVVVAGCVVVPPSRPVTMDDGSAVDLHVAYDAAKLIWYTVQQHGCIQTDRIAPAVLEKSPDYDFAPSRVVRGHVKERWIAYGCGRTFTFIVDFAADGKGGTDISTKYESSE